jgi:hypothetical protein
MATDAPVPGDERRGTFRSPVEAVHSIGLMFLDDTGYPSSPWLVADVLDVSCGGLCLVVAERRQSPFSARSRVRLNLKLGPAMADLPASVRWSVPAASDHLLILGVQFDTELPELPALLAGSRGLG